MKHFPFFINQSCLLVVNCQLGLELVVRVVVVFVLIFLAEVTILGVKAAVHFSIQRSDAVFIHAAFLSRWEMR